MGKGSTPHKCLISDTERNCMYPSEVDQEKIPDCLIDALELTMSHFRGEYVGFITTLEIKTALEKYENDHRIQSSR